MAALAVKPLLPLAALGCDRSVGEAVCDSGWCFQGLPGMAI